MTAQASTEAFPCTCQGGEFPEAGCPHHGIMAMLLDAQRERMDRKFGTSTDVGEEK